jgi:hypothetical protein
MTPFACRQCGTNDASLRYPSGKMSRCMDCQRYYNIGANAARMRKHQEHSPAVALTHDEFVRWCRSTPRRCASCGVHETDLPRIGLVSTIGLPIAALGIDRIRNSGDYALGNIQFCCFACNKAKGNVFDDAETTRLLGPRIGNCWTIRLGGTAEPGTPPVFTRGPAAEPGPCRSCGRADIPLATGRQCTACAKFKSLAANSRRQRKIQATPDLTLTAEEFAQWYSQQDTVCLYCAIPEEHLAATGVRTQVGHVLRNLGVDRVDNDLGYGAGNMALCCYACNKVKGNVFTAAEMSGQIGPAIGQIWAGRGIPVVTN